jgi:hypothetical protein
MNKVDELNESVPMDVDRVVVVKAWGDMEIDNDLVEVDNDLQDIMEIHNDRLGSTWRMINYATNDVQMKAF